MASKAKAATPRAKVTSTSENAAVSGWERFMFQRLSYCGLSGDAVNRNRDCHLRRGGHCVSYDSGAHLRYTVALPPNPVTWTAATLLGTDTGATLPCVGSSAISARGCTE